jgi:beta-lactamase regulating signal transducer with metallopeptidase domain
MSDLLAGLFEMNLAAAAAIATVLWLRKPVHAQMGPGAAYLLWLIVPVMMLATLAPPADVHMLTVEDWKLREYWLSRLTPFGAVLVAAWIAGAAAMLVHMIKRQYLFMRDMELGLAGPAVVGWHYTRIITPADFFQRFSWHEQRLILSHEQVHLERGDARINAMVALVRCLCWFNPMIHIGAKALHADQELSCDAEVIERRPKTRRAYAETLLKTQLTARALPMGCYWPAAGNHPLAERIDMLARTPHSVSRRVAAACGVMALIGGGGFAVWAAQPAREVLAEPPEVLVTFDPSGGPAASSAQGMNVQFLPPAPDDAPTRERPPPV